MMDAYGKMALLNLPVVFVSFAYPRICALKIIQNISFLSLFEAKEYRHTIREEYDLGYLIFRVLLLRL